MKYLFSILMACWGGTFLAAQQWALIDSIQLDPNDLITDFDSDDFNNLYYVRNYSELVKIDADHQKRTQFSNRNLLEQLNVQNILQITLRSGLFNLLILDNHLNLVQDPIQFPIEGNFSPTLTALVDNNFLWGFDPVLQKLVLWNYQEQHITRQSTLLSGKTQHGHFSHLFYQNNQIYLVSADSILQFDEYAVLEKIYPIPKFDQITLKNHIFYYSAADKLFQFALADQSTTALNLDRSLDFFSINLPYLFGSKAGVIYIYKILKSE